MKNKPKVVIIGGGTGIYPVTTALKHLEVDITTIVAVSDSGGSTGRIRDEFGFQPVGDLRQSVAALAEDKNQEWIRKLLLYRFKKGQGLKGHNLGNLILTALQDMTGDTDEALLRTMQIFRLDGQVIPSTKDNINLQVTYQDGSTSVGENLLNPEHSNGKQVIGIALTPSAKLNPFAQKAIEQADVIIIGPGDHYASILATLLPNGTKQAFAKSKAKIVFIVNLMTRHHQTDHMSASDHVSDIEEAIGQPVTQILLNNTTIPSEVVARYQQQHEHPVDDDLKSDSRSIRADIIADMPKKAAPGDSLHRSYLRHSSQKLIPVLRKILHKNGYSQV